VDRYNFVRLHGAIGYEGSFVDEGTEKVLDVLQEGVGIERLRWAISHHSLIFLFFYNSNHWAHAEFPHRLVS